MNELLVELAKYNDDWYRIAFSFLDNKEDAEDIVQDMYLHLHRKEIDLDKIRYKSDINRFFMFLTIRNLCIDFIRNKKETTEFNDMLSLIPEDSIEDYLGILIERVCEESKRWHTYDRNLFEFYMYSGLSYRDISNGTDKKARLISNNKELKEDPVKRGSNISVNSIYTTINICKNKLRDSLSEDFEDYFNNELDKI